MNMTTKLSAALALLLVAGCDDAQKTPPTTTGAVTPTPAVEQKPAEVKPAEVAVAKPTMLAVLDKPASQWTIDGKSLSRVTNEELLAAAKKTGWTKDDTVVTPLIGGQYEAHSFPIEKGKMKGTVKIVRPTATPGTAETVSGFAQPSALGASMNAETAAYTYDADADVFVGVDMTEGGKAADAKKVLDAMVVKSKTPIEGRGIVATGAAGTDTAGHNAAGADTAAGHNAAGTDTAAANGAKTGTTGAPGDGSHNTKDSNQVVPEANGKANSAPRKPEKDSNSIPPKRTTN